LKVQISGLRVQISGFRFQGSGFRVQDSGFRVQGSRFRVRGSEFRFQGSGSRIQGSDFGFKVYMLLRIVAGGPLEIAVEVPRQDFVLLGLPRPNQIQMQDWFYCFTRHQSSEKKTRVRKGE